MTDDMLRRAALIFACLLVSAATAALAAGSRAAEPVRSVRVYALDCGRITFADMGLFADTGEYDGKPGAMAVPCFVIRHPSGTLIWDTGLGDKLAADKRGVDVAPGIHFSVAATLVDQLKAVNLSPAEVTYLAFSHLHSDHTGNANLFGGATWIVNASELAWAESTPTPFGVDPSTFSAYRTAKTQMIDGDYDVFGDGSVRILKAPGHTPGHQVLEVKLKKSGVVILSGDLYHTGDNRRFRRVPNINVRRADTLASMDRIEKIAKNTNARLVIQHDPRDFKSLPKFPAYLD